jgi:hypothetical protein
MNKFETCKRKNPTEADFKKAVNFILGSGSWLNPSIQDLRPEDWGEILESYVMKIGHLFENCSGFYPLRKLRIGRNFEKEHSLVGFCTIGIGNGLTLDTECFEVGSWEVSREISKNSIYIVGGSLLVTRKEEWVVGSYEATLYHHNDSIKLRFNVAEFERTNDIIRYFKEINYSTAPFKEVKKIVSDLAKMKIKGRPMMERLHQLIADNVEEMRKKMAEAEDVLQNSNEHRARIERVIS